VPCRDPSWEQSSPRRWLAFSFDGLTTLHWNAGRMGVLALHVLILPLGMMVIAVARHATDLRREVRLLLGALVVVRLG